MLLELPFSRMASSLFTWNLHLFAIILKSPKRHVSRPTQTLIGKKKNIMKQRVGRMQRQNALKPSIISSFDDIDVIRDTAIITVAHVDFINYWSIVLLSIV